MPFDFPDSPVIGDIITVPGGPSYSYDGAKWTFDTSSTSSPPTPSVQQVFIGTLDATTGATDYTVISGYPDGALLPASGVVVGNYVIVKTAGTIPPGMGPPEVLIPLLVGDWLISDGTVWVLVRIPAALGGSTIYTTDDPPPNVPVNSLWWETDTGNMFVLYEDVDSTQWVQVNATTAGPATVTVADFAPIKPIPNQLWWNSNDTNLYMWHNDGTSTQWVQVSGDSQQGGDFVLKTGDTMTGQLTMNAELIANQGIGFGSSTATSVTDLTRHLGLYGTTFGLNITGGTMNYVVPASNYHHFHVGGAKKFEVYSGGAKTESNINSVGYIDANGGLYATSGNVTARNGSKFRFQPTANGTTGVTALTGEHQNGSSAGEQRIVPGGDNGSGGIWEWWRIGGGYGTNWSMKTTNDSEPGLRVNGSMLGNQVLVRSSASLKQDIRYDLGDIVQAFDALKPARYRLQDQVWPPTFEDGTPVENPERVTRRDRFGFIADDMQDPLLEGVVETLDAEDRGIDITQILTLTVAKIKQLEAEIELLKSRMP